MGRVKTEVESQRGVIRHACGVSALAHSPVTPLYLKASEPIFVNVTGSNRISSSAPYRYRVPRFNSHATVSRLSNLSQEVE